MASRGSAQVRDLRPVLAAVPLVVVVAAPAVASWHGLMAAGREVLGLSGAWAALVPLTLDAAALYAAVLSLRSVLAGDSALGDRLMVWLYALGSAALNVWHADRVGGVAAALFYGVASVSAVVLWDRTLRAHRRDRLREVGALAPPAPRFRALRWVIRPRETWQAWSAAIADGVTSPTEALHRVHAEAGRLFAPPAPWPAAAGAWPSGPVDGVVGAGKTSGAVAVAQAVEQHLDREDPAGEAQREVVRTAVDRAIEVGRDPRERALRLELADAETKGDQLRIAWRELGVVGVPATSDVIPAVVWLAEHGVVIDRSRAYEVRRRVDARETARVSRAVDQLDDRHGGVNVDVEVEVDAVEAARPALRVAP